MAFSYNKKNLANTTITGAITSSDTSITVDDATVFPSGYFYATLMPSSEMSTFSNSEIVLVTNISSNTLTIARGQKNTTARAFSAGAIITNGVYTEDLDFAQSVGKKIFSATWGGQDSPYYKITDDMLKVVPDEGTSIRVIFDTDYSSGTANLSINESSSGVATVSGSSISISDAANLAPLDVKLRGDTYRQSNPSPTNPQTIQVVGGEQTVTISDGNSNTQTFNIQLSNNLYYSTLQRGYLDEDTGALLTNTTSRMVSDFVSVRPNSTYTLSAKTGVSGRTVQASVYYYTNNNFISYANWSSVAKTFTTPANATRIRIVFRLDNSAECTSASFYDIQVEKGSSATAYSGFVCLSKLTNSSGNAQDYIYKSGSDWYIHKETSYIVCNGSETWTNMFSNVGRKDIALANVNYSNLWLVLSDNYLTNVSLDDNSIFLSSSAGGVSIIDKTNGTDVTAWVNYLSIHNISILYPLATPTNTKITDATLISQLNALANATLYAGTNNIVVTGGLSGILEVQYFRSGSSVNPVPIVNGAYVADDNTRNVAPVKAGIPYDLTYHSGNWYVMNMVKKVTADGIDWTTLEEYSTTERCIGKWVNGKPLYQKVVQTTTPSNIVDTVTSTLQIPFSSVGLSNIDLIFVNGLILADGTTQSAWILNNNTYFVRAGVLKAQSNLYTQTNRVGLSGVVAYIVVRYTKTTDQEQTRSVPDDETDDKKGGEEEPEKPEEPVEEPQEK